MRWTIKKINNRVQLHNAATELRFMKRKEAYCEA